MVETSRVQHLSDAEVRRLVRRTLAKEPERSDAEVRRLVRRTLAKEPERSDACGDGRMSNRGESGSPVALQRGGKSPTMVNEPTPTPPKKEVEQVYTRDCLAIDEVAKIYGCSAFIVRGWLHKYNIPINKRGGILPVPPKEDFEVHVAACGGLPTQTHLYRKLAEIYGCSVPTIAKWFRVHGLDASPYLLPPFSKKETLERLFVYESLSIEDIARMYHRSTDNTTKWLRRHGLITPSPPQMPSEAKLRQHIQSREHYRSATQIYKEIARICGCSLSAIRECVQVYGIDKDFRPYPLTKTTLEHLYIDRKMDIAQIMAYHDWTGYDMYATIRLLLVEYGITSKMGKPSAKEAI